MFIFNLLVKAVMEGEDVDTRWKLGSKEYGMIRVLRSLADEKRYMILKTLKDDSIWAENLYEPLGISRPALNKHIRILKNTKLLTENYLTDEGKIKVKYSITDYGSKILKIFNDSLLPTINQVDVVTTLKLELYEAEMERDSVAKTIDRIKEKFTQGKITKEQYRNFKQQYESKLSRLSKSIEQIQSKIALSS